MNFVLFENENGKETFVWENELESLPNGTIAFTYYQQNNTDENGFVCFHEYRIGIPVKFVIGDMYIQLNLDKVADSRNDDIYCLYAEYGKRKFRPINQNTTLVNNFSELEDYFKTVIKKEQVRKR